MALLLDSVRELMRRKQCADALQRNNAQEIELYGRKCVWGAAIQLSGSLGEKGARYLTDFRGHTR